MEYVPKKYLVKNFLYNKTAKIIKENINDVYIKRLIKREIVQFDIHGKNGTQIQKEETEEYNIAFKPLLPINYSDFYWKIAIRFFPASYDILKTQIYSVDDLILQKKNLYNFESLLKIFFVKNDYWKSLNKNKHIFVDESKIVYSTNQYTWFSTDFRWEYYENSEDLLNNLEIDDRYNVIPYLKLIPVFPSNNNIEKSYFHCKHKLEDMSKENILRLYDELIKISSLLQHFKLIYFEGPTFTIGEDFHIYKEHRNSIREHEDSDDRKWDHF